MALQEFVGLVVLEVDGREVEVTSLKVTDMTGRRAVRTMNKTGRTAGFTRGLGQFDLSLSAVIPTSGSPIDWGNISGAKITVQPQNGGRRTSYLDCFTTKVGEDYGVENEARIDIEMTASRKVVE